MSDNTRKADRRLGTRLVKLADNDEWGKCLSILLQRQEQQQKDSDEPLVWLGGKTEDGDALVHLAAYAACESAMSLKKRRLALECLELILESDASALQRIPADGGSALHSAIAAASASTMEAIADNDVDDEESSSESESDDSEIDDMWESGSDSDCTDSQFLSIQQSTKYAGLNNEQVTLTAIDLLLQHGANPNKPMRNDIGDSDMEEMEFIYSREAIMEQWTPFTLCIIWAALASMKSELWPSDDAMMLPLIAIKGMLLNGADPSCPMGANAPSNGVELIASCSHCFKTRIRCNLLHESGIEVFHEEKTLMVSECIHQMLQKYTKVAVPELTKEQAFAAALTGDDVESASKTLSQDQDDIVKWRSLRLSDLLPMPQATWCASRARESWTILSACVAMMATSSVRFLLTPDDALHEANAIQSIGITFSNEGMARDVILNLQQIDSNDEGRRHSQIELCSALVNAVYPPSSMKGAKLVEKRQMFLDRLLLRACSDKKWGDLNAVDIFLSLGADSNTESVASLVDSSFRPLHFVAANRVGRNGVAMAKALVDAGANANICDANGESPLIMALKHKNSLVVEYLWQTTKQRSDAIRSSNTYEFGVSAIACQSLPMLQQAVASLKNSTNDLGTAAVEAALGRLLLACVDERSGFKMEKESDGSWLLVKAFSIILDVEKSLDSDGSIVNAQALEPMPSLQCDEISKYTVLHSILRKDRGKVVRQAMLAPLCDLASKRESRAVGQGEMGSTSWINLPCDAKFGSYTALHLACALGCEESIQTLLRFGADVTAQDYQGNQPFQLLSKTAQLSPATSEKLGRK